MKKLFIAILLLAGTANATSMARYERWTCSFPAKNSAGIGVNVNIVTDVLTSNVANVTLYAVCTMCRIEPITFTAVRTAVVGIAGTELFFNNSQTKFEVNVHASQFNKQTRVSPAILTRANQQSQNGNCTLSLR